MQKLIVVYFKLYVPGQRSKTLISHFLHSAP